MVGVESREKNRQVKQRNGDRAVKVEKQKRYTMNPDTVFGGHAREMDQLNNELLEIRRRLIDLMNAPEEKLPINMRRVDMNYSKVITFRDHHVLHKKYF
ncbi:Hypothetical predicted protein [Octopus vulgaris]|uniref:Uncharacterized protein n=1 Tax=Octopus vulgaris TaxID=6645 RepID=A0AA36F0G7_OCTVU|nr:Hypothetical predicted protein [Octopus vulgaris]